MGIGSKINNLMNEQNINANELANRVGVAPTTLYSMIKRDSKKADIEVLIKIANELGVSVEYFSDDYESSSNGPKTHCGDGRFTEDYSVMSLDKNFGVLIESYSNMGNMDRRRLLEYAKHLSALKNIESSTSYNTEDK